eukprot:CAMPEP_0114991986 /NCGR_PEP_ID=MMETSP0216-20121206/11684_1 /TAXON_ID=223996 /ORGANISM="Protocruzia adherens, Strain Boccale" /LENGTH=136 /DNA_ID=CAMNT_0002355389 /DNA_START=804 /DNA_END=1210 /DNA_ORIENTATION=-
MSPHALCSSLDCLASLDIHNSHFSDINSKTSVPLTVVDGKINGFTAGVIRLTYWVGSINITDSSVIGSKMDLLPGHNDISSIDFQGAGGAVFVVGWLSSLVIENTKFEDTVGSIAGGVYISQEDTFLSIGREASFA